MPQKYNFLKKYRNNTVVFLLFYCLLYSFASLSNALLTQGSAM